MSFFKVLVNNLLLCAACAVAWHGTAAAQSDYPSRPVQIVVPFPAGGGGDIFVRAIANELKGELNQTVVVDNVPGADGEIAATQVARSAPDGYKMLFATPSAFSYSPNIHLTKPPYDPLRDFVPVANIGTYSFVLVVHESVPVRNFRELVAYAKSHPGELVYGTGNATAIVMMGQLARSADIDMRQIPYKGDAQALPDLLAGRIHLLVVSPQLIEQHKGKVRPVVILGPHRTPLFPNVPTMSEEGFAGVKVVQWIGFVMPGRTPKPIVDRMSLALNKVFAKPEIQKRAEAGGAVATGSTPEQMAELLKTQLEAWREAVKAANLPTD